MFDERYMIHRLKSTSLAGIVGAASMGGYFLYEQIVRGVIHHEIFIFLTIMAVTKVVLMFYFRIRN